MSDLMQIAGVSSGIAWDEIINKTLEKAAKPAQQWQNQIDKLEVKKTLYQDLSSEFQKLRNTLTKLRLESTYKTKMAEFSVQTPPGKDAASIIKATVKPDAVIASWDIDVKQIAKVQRHMSNKYSSPGESLGITGSFRVHVGTQFSTIEIESGDSIRDINLKVQKAKDQYGDSMDLTAKLVDNRLVIESAKTGLNKKTGDKQYSMVMGYNKTLVDPDDEDSGYKYEMYLPRTQRKLVDPDDPSQGYVPEEYPQQILIRDTQDDGNGKYYKYGQDYTYDPTTGLITWNVGNGAITPDPGTQLDIVFSEDLIIGKNPGVAEDLLPILPSGQDYDAGMNFEIYDTDGKKYVMGTDFNFDPINQSIVWVDPTQKPAGYVVRFGAGQSYTYEDNRLYLTADDMGEDSALAKLGFITADPTSWMYTEGNYQDAQDAIFTIDGIPVERWTNTIDGSGEDAIIANVNLELKGEGHVTMDITQDATAAIESMDAFVEAYNKVMDWINLYVNQKEDAANAVDEEDYLSSIISQNKGKTNFGVLHGDQLLWSIKNQMRNKVSDPIRSLSNSLASRKFLDPKAALDMEGSFYIHMGKLSARINIEKTDSLERIQTKLEEAMSINSANGSTASNKELKLDVSIRDGQLVINAPSNVKKDEKADTIIRGQDNKDFDNLSYVPQPGVPTNGTLTIYTGEYVKDSAGNIISEPTYYQEGSDYEIQTSVTDNGTLQSKIVWLQGGKAPSSGSSYKVLYDYNPSAINYEMISGSGNLNGLDLHYDTSNVSLSTMGITTSAEERGKTGKLEFDSEKFFEAIKGDSQQVSNVMLTFMRDLDSYIGNLVDSSQMLVAGSVVTKGRIAGALNKIDNEVSTLNDRIVKLEKDLKAKQTALYKQYSDMEVAMQKLNAQMSSMTQYFSNMNRSS